MLNAILFAIVGFLETVVNWSLGAVLIVVGIAGMLAASRWLLSQNAQHSAVDGTLAAPRHGTLAGTLAAVLVFGFGSILAGLFFLTH